jgi:predicted transcriptional regulator
MDIQDEKVKLIEWLSSIKDREIIETLTIIKDNITDRTDWWESISNAEKESIERGLKDLEEGKIIPHSEVMKKYGL